MAAENEKSESIPTKARRGLVLLAHGSHDRQWLSTCERLQGQVGSKLGVQVDLAYLQMAAPSLPTVAQRLWNSGVRQLVVIPIFFSAGGHVAKDIPRLIDEVEALYPDLEVEVTSPVGEDPRFASLVVELSREALA